MGQNLAANPLEALPDPKDFIKNEKSMKVRFASLDIPRNLSYSKNHRFRTQVNEIIKKCPIERQTLLFSATLPDSLYGLTEKFMKNPLKIRWMFDGKRWSRWTFR